MVIRDFYVEHVTVFPYEAKPELIVDPYTELSLTFGLQSLKAVPGRNAKIVQSSCCIHQKKLSQGRANQARRKLPGFTGQPK